MINIEQYNFIDPEYIIEIRKKLVSIGNTEQDICVIIKRYNRKLEEILRMNYNKNIAKNIAKNNLTELNTIILKINLDIDKKINITFNFKNEKEIYKNLKTIINILFNKNIDNELILNYENKKYYFYEKIPDNFLKSLKKKINGINTNKPTIIQLVFAQLHKKLDKYDLNLNFFYKYSTKYNKFIDIIKKKYNKINNLESYKFSIRNQLYKLYQSNQIQKIFKDKILELRNNLINNMIEIKKEMSYLIQHIELFKLHINNFKTLKYGLFKNKKISNETKIKCLIDKLKSYIDTNEIKHIYINFIKEFIKILNGGFNNI